MNSTDEVEVDVEVEVEAEVEVDQTPLRRRCYLPVEGTADNGTPLRKTSDGEIYAVLQNGSWRRMGNTNTTKAQKKALKKMRRLARITEGHDKQLLESEIETLS